MASRGKKKTTMAKLNREAKLRDRKLEKQARKDARKQASAEPPAEMNDELGVAER
jgi:HAMP domain-containing protein